MSRQFIVYDTETTGLRKARVDLTTPSSPKLRGDEVCQIGGIVLNERMEPQKLFCHYCDTVVPEVSRDAAEVNGLSMQELRQYVRCQYLPNVIHDHVPEFLWNNTIFLGYNVEFDQNMVQQTMSNSDLQFDWTPFKGNILPKSGRWSVDVAEFFKQAGNAAKGKRGYYRRLHSFVEELAPAREDFFVRYGCMEVQTNCMKLLGPSWNQEHNAFFDALNTFLLWRDRVWQKKLI